MPGKSLTIESTGLWKSAEALFQAHHLGRYQDYCDCGNLNTQTSFRLPEFTFLLRLSKNPKTYDFGACCGSQVGDFTRRENDQNAKQRLFRQSRYNSGIHRLAKWSRFRIETSNETQQVPEFLGFMMVNRDYLS